MLLIKRLVEIIRLYKKPKNKIIRTEFPSVDYSLRQINIGKELKYYRVPK